MYAQKVVQICNGLSSQWCNVYFLWWYPQQQQNIRCNTCTVTMLNEEHISRYGVAPTEEKSHSKVIIGCKDRLSIFLVTSSYVLGAVAGLD